MNMNDEHVAYEMFGVRIYFVEMYENDPRIDTLESFVERFNGESK